MRSVATLIFSLIAVGSACGASCPKPQKVNFSSGAWKIFADFYLPTQAEQATPVVLMFNKAAGDRSAYRRLACELQNRGAASIAVDLRGHGESTNLGKFMPGKNVEITAESEQDVQQAIAFVRADKRFGAKSDVVLVGASYSGEFAAKQSERGIESIVLLSPGSLSDESIDAIDKNSRRVLLVISKDEKHLKEVLAAVRERSHHADIMELRGTAHATDILESHPEANAMIADWITHAPHRVSF